MKNTNKIQLALLQYEKTWVLDKVGKPENSINNS